jgi:hypothetical protein
MNPNFPDGLSEAGQMAASDYVPTFFKNRLHLVGRPQMARIIWALLVKKENYRAPVAAKA